MGQQAKEVREAREAEFSSHFGYDSAFASLTAFVPSGKADIVQVLSLYCVLLFLSALFDLISHRQVEVVN